MPRSLDHLRLRDLALLEHVQRLGTLRQVAQALHVSQPAVTQMLHSLEDVFGVALVERGRRGVRLTPAGEAACHRLRCGRAEIEQARRAAAEHERPLLRLGATPIASLRLLPQAIGQLQRRLPQARVTLTEAGVGALWRQLAEGELDALVGRLPFPQPPAEGLHHVTVGRERLVLVARERHPLLRGGVPRGRAQWSERLARSGWVLPPGESMALPALHEWFSQAGLPPPVPIVESGSFHATLQIVSQADLLGVVPETAARAQGPDLGVLTLRAPWPQPLVDLVFAARELHWDSAPMAALRQCFTARRA